MTEDQMLEQYRELDYNAVRAEFPDWKFNEYNRRMTRRLQSIIVVDRFEFDIFFYFFDDGGGLGEINIESENQIACDRVMPNLTSVYSEYSMINDGRHPAFFDRENDVRLVFFDGTLSMLGRSSFSGYCRIKITPIPTAL